ncbi:MAG: AAA family ATPase [Bacteroidia bacterium]|nr:AAA family ATPase [Bacteroidia bacterium]
MGKLEIIGRKAEIKRLDRILLAKKSSFICVYGRRRVGKTYMIREYFSNEFDFQMTGLSNATTQQQLINFQVSFQHQAPEIITPQIPETWFEAFKNLVSFLENSPTERKKIIFFDEMPWLDTPRSDFIMALEHFWNSWASARKDIILIACGSAASWMINNLINNHGGLHNRITERMKIHPFTLGETELYLKARNISLNRYQIIELYMAFGGIPYYLDWVLPGESSAQTIDRICFQKDAPLMKEFPNLFSSLFRNPEQHESIVAALAGKTVGMSRGEITEKAHIQTGGTLTKLLGELEESGFITSYSPYMKKARNTIYRLSDFYSFFYLKFLSQNKTHDPGTWALGIDNPAHRAWAGYTFEQICLAHIPQIKKALGIGGVVTQSASWKSTQSAEGVQIDLLIDRRDQVINLCEIKFSISPYTIRKKDAEGLRRKIGTFKSETRTRKSVFLTMITTFGLESNEFSTEIVQSDLTMDALFD